MKSMADNLLLYAGAFGELWPVALEAFREEN